MHPGKISSLFCTLNTLEQALLLLQHRQVHDCLASSYRCGYNPSCSVPAKRRRRKDESSPSFERWTFNELPRRFDRSNSRRDHSSQIFDFSAQILLRPSTLAIKRHCSNQRNKRKIKVQGAVASALAGNRAWVLLSLTSTTSPACQMRQVAFSKRCPRLECPGSELSVPERRRHSPGKHNRPFLLQYQPEF